MATKTKNNKPKLVMSICRNDDRFNLFIHSGDEGKFTVLRRTDNRIRTSKSLRNIVAICAKLRKEIIKTFDVKVLCEIPDAQHIMDETFPNVNVYSYEAKG